MTKRFGWVAAGVLLASLALGQPAMAQKVRLATTAGDIVLELDRDKAPKTVDNFLNYVKSGFYSGTVFHRVIPNFMIQGGGMTPDMDQKRPGESPVRNESLNGLKNLRGSLAAARTSDPDSATSQFFINLKDNDFLDGNPGTKKIGYSVFGKVTAGMDVVDKIAAVKTTTKGGHGDVPEQAVIIKSVRRAK